MRITLRYEATFNDPSVYTRPWTFGLDMKRGLFGGDGLQTPTAGLIRRSNHTTDWLIKRYSEYVHRD